MRTESMSKNIINVLTELSKNDGLLCLLLNNTKSPFSTTPKVQLSKLISDGKITPYPFDTEATIADGAFIRVYYNDGELDSAEVISESQIHIDIICARSLWLINGIDGQPLIRPYEMLSRVIDSVGSRSLNSSIRLDIKGYQHLYINSKFDAIRLYCEYMSVET